MLRLRRKKSAPASAPALGEMSWQLRLQLRVKWSGSGSVMTSRTCLATPADRLATRGLNFMLSSAIPATRQAHSPWASHRAGSSAESGGRWTAAGACGSFCAAAAWTGAAGGPMLGVGHPCDGTVAADSNLARGGGKTFGAKN